MYMSVIKKLQHFFHAQNTGARVITVDEFTYVVYDCVAWDSELEQALSKQFNNIHIDIRNSSKSLTGFEIVLHISNILEPLGWLVATIPLFMILGMLLHSYWV